MLKRETPRNYYQLELLAALRKAKARFTVSVPRNQAMWKALGRIAEDDWQEASEMPGAEVAETTYAPDGWKHEPLRLIVRRTPFTAAKIAAGSVNARRRKTTHPEQLQLALEGKVLSVFGYSLILTDHPAEETTAELERHHRCSRATSRLANPGRRLLTELSQKGARFALWKNAERLTDRQPQKLARIQQINKRLFRAYLLAQQLRQVYPVERREDRVRVGVPVGAGRVGRNGPLPGPSWPPAPGPWSSGGRAACRRGRSRTPSHGRHAGGKTPGWRDRHAAAWDAAYS